MHAAWVLSYEVTGIFLFLTQEKLPIFIYSFLLFPGQCYPANGEKSTSYAGTLDVWKCFVDQYSLA